MARVANQLYAVVAWVAIPHFGLASGNFLHWDWSQRTSAVGVDRSNVIETLVKQGKDRAAAEKEADQVVAALSSPQSKKARIAVLLDEKGFAMAWYEGKEANLTIRMLAIQDEKRGISARFEVGAGRSDGIIRKYEAIQNFEEFLGTSLAVPILTGWSPGYLVGGGRDPLTAGTVDVPASPQRRDGYRIEYSEKPPGWKATAVGSPARVTFEQGTFRVAWSNIENTLAPAKESAPETIQKLLREAWSKGGVQGASVQDWRLGEEQVKLYTFVTLPTLDELLGLPADPRITASRESSAPADPRVWWVRFGVLMLLMGFAYWLGTRRRATPPASA